MSMSGYPYQVVQGPQSASYAGPNVNWSAPLQALTGQRPPQPGQQGAGAPYGQINAQQYAQLLQRLFGRGSTPGGTIGGSVVPQGYNPNVTGGLY